MDINVKVKRLDGRFQTKGIGESGSEVIMDAAKCYGGNAAGTSPKELLLIAMGGCTTIDVTELLEEEGHVANTIDIEISAIREKDVVPSLFERISVQYIINGDVPTDVVTKCVKLSFNKYCSIANLLSKSAELVCSIMLNGELLEEGFVKN